MALTSEHLHMFIISCGIHLAYFYLIKTFVPFIGKDRKRLSWVLTLATALTVSILGPYATFGNIRTVFSEPIPYEMYNPYAVEGLRQVQRYDVLFQLPANSLTQWQDQTWNSNCLPEQTEESETTTEYVMFYKAYDAMYNSPPTVWHSLRHFRWFFDLRHTPSDSPIAQAAVIFFGCYLILDMACGALHYRERVTILTGWFHHTMYTGICYYTLITGESHTFASFLVIEVPTFFMGLGFLHKPLRNDLLFGLTFILFRILFDFALTHEMVMNRAGLTTISRIILLFKSCMNFKFLIDWINQQIRLRREKASTLTAVMCETGVQATEVKSRLDITSPYKNEKGITVHICQHQRQVQSQQSKQGRLQNPQNVKRRVSNGMLTECISDSSSPIMSSPTNSRRVFRNRNTRARAGGMLDDQSLLVVIAAH
ncbi:hypothetical protein BGX20_003589 [Mortierella sp. AD010]|nr:hypothetical protein BGX20_003589 [Mortierella sp. AD010]